ncbi:MAG: GxxExxY protein [Candidatus Cloacimonetes bacterium]|nr:GxxExxY protein [Candidatus Cloacimonadota bacterium]
MEYKHSELTELIIKCFYKVYNTLGYGFLEKVYENAIKIELIINGLSVESQKPIKVFYEGKLVGEYFADLVVNDLIILELKAQEKLIPENEAQLLNYLKATKYEIGLLLNFGKKPEIKRKIYSNK